MKMFLMQVVKFAFEYRRPIGAIVGGILIVTGNKELGNWVQSFNF